MVKFQAKRLVLTFLALDILSTALAWLSAYWLRFQSGAVLQLLPASKGIPDPDRYLLLLPAIALLWPAVLYFHGLYQVRRSRRSSTWPRNSASAGAARSSRSRSGPVPTTRSGQPRPR